MIQARADELSWREVEGEVILLDERNWTYVHLNGSAALLWALVAEGAEESTLVGRLVDDYGIDQARASTDVQAFVVELTKRKLLAS